MGTLRRTCAKVREPSELRFGLVGGVGRGVAVLDGGPRGARERGGFGDFASPFLQWQKPILAQAEQICQMYTTCVRKIDNISVRPTYRWKARFVGFLAMYSFPRSQLGFSRNSQLSNSVSRFFAAYAAKVQL